MRMMDDMERDRGFMQEPQGFMVNDGPFNRMDFPDRHECRPRFEGPDPAFRHQEFGNRPPAPALPFYRPELEYEPRFRSPEFCDRPRDFCPPEFRGRPPNFRPPEFDGGPGFHMMNPAFDQMEQFGPRDQHYMPPMDPHGNHSFGERGGFAAPLAPDFRGPGPVQPPSEAFSSAPRPACSPQPPQKKDQLAPKETEPPKSMALKISSFKNISAK
ncbi:extensin-like [Puntigrus tetrazona]|uniref:extensin-like n=1 Tax=Puntigrus tetrazona TaxID=1606681 RepID=UPI001C89C43F|nr:extensin-like [Puntigrus tetrazona]